MNNFYYQKLTPFKWFVLQNFPFIEADFDALTDWQLFCKLGQEMNKIINSTNILGEQVQSLTDFVINYFDNLDIQEEVDNKINEMAESGELQEIIISYLQMQGVLSFNTIEDMAESETVIEGSTCIVLGQNTLYDGFVRFYKIEKIISVNPSEIDGLNLVNIGRDDLYARLVKDNTIEKINNLEKLFLSIDNFPKEEGETTDTERIQRAIDLLNSNGGGTLYFPKGNYILNDTIKLYPYISIIGDNFGNTRFDGDFNKPMFEITDKTQRNDGVLIKNINLHRAYLDNDTAIIDFQYVGYSKIENVSLYNHTANYNSIGILLGAFSYYDVIEDCQLRGFKKCIYFINEANANIIRGGTCINSENGVVISHTNTTRIIAHSCENLTGTGYSFIDHSLYNIVIGSRLENVPTGFYAEYVSGGQSSHGNVIVTPEFYGVTTQYDCQPSTVIMDSYNWYNSVQRSYKMDFKASKKYGQTALVANTPTKVNWNQVDWDNHSNYDLTNDKLIALTKGT